jgi:hypothetical protein
LVDAKGKENLTPKAAYIPSMSLCPEGDSASMILSAGVMVPANEVLTSAHTSSLTPHRTHLLLPSCLLTHSLMHSPDAPAHTPAPRSAPSIYLPNLGRCRYHAILPAQFVTAKYI